MDSEALEPLHVTFGTLAGERQGVNRAELRSFAGALQGSLGPMHFSTDSAYLKVFVQTSPRPSLAEQKS